jgi:hypothetical protein
MALAADPAGDSAGALTGDSATKVVFNRDVRPILSDLCFQCHGPDEKKREGGLRLDLRDAAIATTAIVPGNLADSELVARIVSTDPELRMPPPETNKSLSKSSPCDVGSNKGPNTKRTGPSSRRLSPHPPPPMTRPGRSTPSIALSWRDCGPKVWHHPPRRAAKR